MIELDPSKEEHFPGITAMKEELQVMHLFAHITETYFCQWQSFISISFVHVYFTCKIELTT